MSHIPRLRPGWASVICLAPTCCKRARTKVGACLTPGHREYLEAIRAHDGVPEACDFQRWGDYCGKCVKVRGDVG